MTQSDICHRIFDCYVAQSLLLNVIDNYERRHVTSIVLKGNNMRVNWAFTPEMSHYLSAVTLELIYDTEVVMCRSAWENISFRTAFACPVVMCTWWRIIVTEWLKLSYKRRLRSMH